jgi:outer membrane protein
VRSIITLCILAGALLLPAANAHASGVAVVDVPYIIDNSPQAEAASRQLQQNFGPVQQQMQSKQQEYQEIAESLERDALVMDEQEQAEAQQRLQELEQEIRQMEQQFQQQLGMEQEQAFSRIQEIVREIVNELADEGGYDVVVGQGVLYARDSVDLTDRVLERMRERFED